MSNQVPLVLLLGAGATLGARCEQAYAPPLGNRLATFLRDWLDASDRREALAFVREYRRFPEARQRIEAAAREEMLDTTSTSSPPFERMVAALSGSDSFVARTVHRILAYAFLFPESRTFLEGHDGYDDLIKHLRLTERETIIITLNYDVLLEEALDRCGVQVSYPKLKDTQGNVKLFKPHGSVNWTTMKPLGIASSYEAAVAQTPALTFVDAGSYVGVQSGDTRVFRRSAAFSILRDRIDLAPVIAMYTPGKFALDNSHHLDAHRRSCMRCLEGLVAADVVAIGVRRATLADDEILHNILGRLSAVGGSKTYVSPSDSDCRQFEELGFVSAVSPLDEWLESINP